MNFQTIVYIYTGFVWALVVLMLTMLIYRTIRVVYHKQSRLPLSEIQRNGYLKLLKLLFGITMLTAIPNVIFFAYVASAFKTIIPSYLNHILVIVTIWLALWELFLCFSVSEKLVSTKFKKIILTLIVLLFFPLSIYFTSNISAMMYYPAVAEADKLDFPVDGTWVATNAGGSEYINMHHMVKAQHYAIDMVKLNNDGSFYTGTGNELTDHVSYDEVVISPVNGIIHAKLDTFADGPITLKPPQSSNPAGNHVVIRTEDDHYIFIAHLQKYSIPLEVGERVIAGDIVGRVGNTGNTTWPHLHIHIQDVPQLNADTANGLPFVFKNMEVKRWLFWNDQPLAIVNRNDLMRQSIKPVSN